MKLRECGRGIEINIQKKPLTEKVWRGLLTGIQVRKGAFWRKV